ncbi:hypothetical protein [Intestinibacter sp.]|uniref:hypothetical protein n=1 Tax=Intestinibacter sp. TaxID=1965304 RepID=UPI003F1913C6
MEERVIKLTLDKAKEFYKKGGEFKDLALSAFSEEELNVKLPRTWREFCKSYNMQSPNECFIGLRSNIIMRAADVYERDPVIDKNVLPSEEAAEAHLALMQLHQLRDCYRQGWKPDWKEDYQYKYCIVLNKNILNINRSFDWNSFLSFQSEEIAEEFLNNFRDLIIQAGDLI